MEDVLRAEADLSTEELFHRVLQDLRADDDEQFGALVALHGRPTRQVVDRCVALCSSDDPFERSAGLRVLRELGHPYVDGDRLWALVESLVVQLARSDESPDVVRWAISCLGYQAQGQPALDAVLGHTDHGDERIRFAVAAALPHLTDPAAPDGRAVDALLTLAEDEDADVRSYAIMGLVDDLHLARAVEPTLRAHVSDPDDQIRRYCRETLAGPTA